MVDDSAIFVAIVFILAMVALLAHVAYLTFTNRKLHEQIEDLEERIGDLRYQLDRDAEAGQHAGTRRRRPRGDEGHESSTAFEER
jgi:hypothetical protein